MFYCSVPQLLPVVPNPGEDGRLVPGDDPAHHHPDTLQCPRVPGGWEVQSSPGGGGVGEGDPVWGKGGAVPGILLYSHSDRVD